MWDPASVANTFPSHPSRIICRGKGSPDVFFNEIGRRPALRVKSRVPKGTVAENPPSASSTRPSLRGAQWSRFLTPVLAPAEVFRSLCLVPARKSLHRETARRSANSISRDTACCKSTEQETTTEGGFWNAWDCSRGRRAFLSSAKASLIRGKRHDALPAYRRVPCAVGFMYSPIEPAA